MTKYNIVQDMQGYTHRHKEIFSPKRRSDKIGIFHLWITRTCQRTWFNVVWFKIQLIYAVVVRTKSKRYIRLLRLSRWARYTILTIQQVRHPKWFVTRVLILCSINYSNCWVYQRALVWIRINIQESTRMYIYYLIYYSNPRNTTRKSQSSWTKSKPDRLWRERVR